MMNGIFHSREEEMGARFQAGTINNPVQEEFNGDSGGPWGSHMTAIPPRLPMMPMGTNLPPAHIHGNTDLPQTAPLVQPTHVPSERAMFHPTGRAGPTGGGMQAGSQPEVGVFPDAIDSNTAEMMHSFENGAGVPGEQMPHMSQDGPGFKRTLDGHRPHRRSHHHRHHHHHVSEEQQSAKWAEDRNSRSSQQTSHPEPLIFTREHVGFGPITVEAKTENAPTNDPTEDDE